MIYTIGHTEAYTQFFKEQKEPGFPKKKGRDKFYDGGSVWKTYVEALKVCNINPGFSVYGVLANWDTETTPNIHPLLREIEVTDESNMRWLLNDSTLVEVQEVKIEEPNMLAGIS